MARLALTERFIRSPARVTEAKAAPGGRRDYFDSLVPGMALRVTATGHRSYILVARFPARPQNPTRRALGACYMPPEGGDISAPPLTHGALTLAEVREKARNWLSLIARGIDPKAQEARERAEALRSQRHTFRAVAVEFLDRHAAKLAHAAKARQIVNAEFVKRWGDRPAADIVSEEAIAAIRAIVKRGTPEQARSAFEWLRLLYSWAIGAGEFGITASPLANVSSVALIGKKVIRERVLSDGEMRAIWHAAGECGDGADATMGYPYGPLVRLLMLTGQRVREVAEATWSEIDFAGALWTIPAARMKSGRVHAVPLAPDALALLRTLPRFERGDCVFTTTGGQKPVNGFSAAKARLDRLSGVIGWVFHDIRRSMRTGLSALDIEDRVREQMIAHAAPGLHRIYDQHTYLAEKRRGFELWEQRLRGILSPKPPAAVTDIVTERSRRLP